MNVEIGGVAVGAVLVVAPQAGNTINVMHNKTNPVIAQVWLFNIARTCQCMSEILGRRVSALNPEYLLHCLPEESMCVLKDRVVAHMYSRFFQADNIAHCDIAFRL